MINRPRIILTDETRALQGTPECDVSIDYIHTEIFTLGVVEEPGDD
jgi:hypothetical protein